MTKQLELKKQAYESDLKSRALSVLLYLIDRSNKDLKCFPAIPTMAKQLYISVSTVKRALKELVEEGFVKKESRFRELNRGQTSNLYTLILFEKKIEQESEQEIVGKKQEEINIKNVTFERLKEENIKHDNPVIRKEIVRKEKKIEEDRMDSSNKKFEIEKKQYKILSEWTGEEVNLRLP